MNYLFWNKRHLDNELFCRGVSNCRHAERLKNYTNRSLSFIRFKLGSPEYFYFPIFIFLIQYSLSVYDLSPQQEKLLSLRIAEGDEAAFKELFAYILPALGATIFRLVKTQTDVDDIIQETMLRVWISRDKLAGLEKPRAWVFQIAYFTTFTFLRQKKTRRKALQDLRMGPDLQVETAEERFSFRQTKALIHEAVAALAPQQKKIYLMSREQGLKFSEIASQLGISENTVKNTIVKALKLIRAHLVNNGKHLYTLLGIFLMNGN